MSQIVVFSASGFPDVEYLKETFAIGGETGLIWRYRPSSHFQSEGEATLWNARNAGRPAGGLQKMALFRRYFATVVGKRLWGNHRIVWAIMNGRPPTRFMVIDHIDGDGTNNGPGNLREVTHSENARNRTSVETRRQRVLARQQSSTPIASAT